MINAAEVSNYSGSGSGLPLLIQRSVARQISLINVIGKLSVFIYHTYTVIMGKMETPRASWKHIIRVYQGLFCRIIPVCKH